MTSSRPMSRDSFSRPRTKYIHALHIPADSAIPCSVLDLVPQASELSAAIGGGLLEEAFYGTVQPTAAMPEQYCVYLNEQRSRLAPNQRLMVLAARLGWPERARTIRPDGDTLITGTTTFQDDTDVPIGVLIAAWRGQLLASLPAYIARRQ